MKKNILSIIMIALLVISIVLDVVILFAVVPNANKTNALIDRVASAVDLEIENDSDGDADYSIDDLSSITFENGELTITLKRNEGESSDHYAVINGISLTLNTKDSDYSSVSTYITANENLFKDRINYIFSKYTKDYAQSHIDEIKQEILSEFSSKKVLDSDAVVDVSFGNLAFQ